MPTGMKICSSCGIDVSKQKRVKGTLDRYYCKPCWESLAKSTYPADALILTGMTNEPAQRTRRTLWTDANVVVPRDRFIAVAPAATKSQPQTSKPRRKNTVVITASIGAVAVVSTAVLLIHRGTNGGRPKTKTQNQMVQPSTSIPESLHPQEK